MIRDIKVGDILDRRNTADVIIGMNTDLADVLGIGRRYVTQIRKTREIKLGSVISFQMDGRNDDRELHMLVCHKIGAGGWKNADHYVRYGMDYLWQTRPDREFSIVEVGTGRVGKRDGADHIAIRSAMASSFLSVDLYLLRDVEMPAEASGELVPFRPMRIWDIDAGIAPIQAIAQAA